VELLVAGDQPVSGPPPLLNLRLEIGDYIEEIAGIARKLGGGSSAGSGRRCRHRHRLPMNPAAAAVGQSDLHPDALGGQQIETGSPPHDREGGRAGIGPLAHGGHRLGDLRPLWEAHAIGIPELLVENEERSGAPLELAANARELLGDHLHLVGWCRGDGDGGE
jgi:hypothetical protein